MSADITALDVEGCSAADPLESEEDWDDLVGSQLRYWWSEHKYHDRNGWYAELAGSKACQELGHPVILGDSEESILEHEKYDHSPAFDGGWVCGATRYGAACTECEGECNLADWPADDILWAAVRA